jgi:hypothetical protein
MYPVGTGTDGRERYVLPSKKDAVKNKVVGAVASLALKAIRKFIPCPVRPQIMWVLKLLGDGKKRAEVMKALMIVNRNVLSEVLPAGLLKGLQKMGMRDGDNLVQMGCARQRYAVPCGSYLRTIGTSDQVGGYDWEHYKSQSSFTFYIARASADFFWDVKKSSADGLAIHKPMNPDTTNWGHSCVDPKLKGKCRVDQILQNLKAKKGPRPSCLIKFIITMKMCNSCCCYDPKSVMRETDATGKVIRTTSPAVISNVASSLMNDPAACAGTFTAVDGAVRAFWGLARNMLSTNAYYPRCWRGTFPSAHSPR